MAFSSNHSESNVRDMKIFDVHQPSELIFYSGTGGVQTLLLGVMGDSNTYYYVDSLSLELLEMTDSVLYSNDFNSSSEGWRSKFADTLELTAGRIDWQSTEENMRIWPWSSDMGTIGAVVREIDVEPGIYNMVMAKVSLPDHPHGKVSLGVYDELAANVDFNTLSIEPLGHAEVEEFEETILYFTFLPNTDKMSLVLMYQSEQYGRVLLDDVQVSSIDPFERDTLQSFTFNDTSSVYNEWRSSIWPDSLIANDSILLSYISHDTLLGRMRIEMVEDFNEPDEILGAVYRRMTGLEVGKKYEASFEIQTDGAHQLKQVNSVVFRNSEFSLGNINPEDSNMINIDSLDIGIDSIVLRFTATESDMVISISANARIAAPYHYYIDNFNLRKGFETIVNCDKSNLQYVDGDGRYRFGFNGMEMDDEVKGHGNSLDFGARIYDSRTGRFLSIDPLRKKFPSESNYIFAGNSPIFFIDKKGAYKYPAKQAADYTNTYPMITKYLSEYIQNDIQKSCDIQEAIIKHSENSNLNSDYLINTIAYWGNENSPLIEFGDVSPGTAYTMDSKGFKISASYATHIENTLADENVSTEDKQAAITRFFMTILDETTITQHKKTLSSDMGGVDYPDGNDPGNKVINELYIYYDVEEDGVNYKVPDTGAQSDTGMGNFSGTKNVINRLKENNKTELIPTIPNNE